MAKNKVINTVLTLRDNMSGGLVKAAQNAKKAGKSIDSSMISATRNVVALKNKVRDTAVDAAKNFAKIGTAAVGAVGALAAKTGFAEAMDLEGYKLQLETATKDTQKAADVMRYAIELANKTPFEGGALVEGAAKFEAMGMSATEWLKRTGDMAAATNKSFDQAVEALIDAQVGELERLKEFGITKAKILEQGEKMFTGVQLVNNEGQIVNQEKFNEALIALMEDRFSGGMEKQAQTLRGQMSTVTGILKSGLAKAVGIGEDGAVRTGSAFDLIRSKVSGLSGRLTQWQQDGTLDRLAAQLDTGIAAAARRAGEAFAWAQEHLAPAAGAIAAAGREAFAWARENVLPKAEGALRLVADGFAWLAANMDKVMPVLGALVKLWAASKILKFGGDVVSAGKTLWDFGGALKGIAKTGWNGFATGAAGDAGKVGGAFSKIAGAASPLLAKVAGVGKALFGLVAAHPFITALAAGAVLIIANWSKIQPVLEQLWTRAKEIFGALRSWAVEKLTAIKTTAVNIFTGIRDTARDAVERVKSVFGGIRDSIVGAFDAARNKIGGFFSWLDNKISSIPLLGSIYSGGKAVIGGAVDFVGGSVGSNALGTNYWRGGLTRVNERGGEILNLPSGTQIIPHDISRRMAGGPQVSVNVVVQGNVIGNRQYADELGETIVGRILRALDNR